MNISHSRPKDAVRAIKKRIIGNKNFKEVMLALTVSFFMLSSRGFTGSPFLLLLALCFALFLAPGDMCKELRLQVPHPGDDKGFCRGGPSAVDHPKEQPSTSCA